MQTPSGKSSQCISHIVLTKRWDNGLMVTPWRMNDKHGFSFCGCLNAFCLDVGLRVVCCITEDSDEVIRIIREQIIVGTNQKGGVLRHPLDNFGFGAQYIFSAAEHFDVGNPYCRDDCYAWANRQCKISDFPQTAHAHFDHCGLMFTA
jgi:hypothetical protein